MASIVPTVTVVTTFHNALPWLRNAVESVLAQSVDVYEYILVDDHSTDGSREFLLKDYGNNSKIKIIDTNARGRGYALNTGIRAASGKWIAILDADDLFHPQKLEVQLSYAESHHEPALFCTATCVLREGESPRWVSTHGHPELRGVTKNLQYANVINHSSVLIPRKQLNEVGGYDHDRTGQFDYELWLRWVRNGLPILEINTPLTAKRLHQKQAFEAGNRLPYLCSSIRLQIENSKIQGGGAAVYFFVAMKLVYGLLPRKVRTLINIKRIFS